MFRSLKLDVTYKCRPSKTRSFIFSDRFLKAIAVESLPFMAGEEFCFICFNTNINPFFRYIFAETFSDIAKVTRRSMPGSPLDRMVQLLQSDRIQHPAYEIFGLRRVTYTTTEEIPSLLADLQSQNLSSSQIPSSDFPSNSPLEVNLDLEEGIAEDDHIDDNEASEILSDQEEDPDFIPRTDLPEEIHARHSEDEKHAATIIQRTYRIVLEQRRLRNQTGLKGLNRYYFHLCWKKVREENRESDKYTQAFLGPLPHLLSSLDSAEYLTIEKKGKMKKQFVSVRNETLDEVSSILSRIAYALDPIFVTGIN